MRKLIVLVLLVLSWFATTAYSQGESAVPFLLITASPASNGLGQTSAGLPINDPLIVIDNPAQLGFQALNNYAGYSYTKMDWLPQFQQSDLYLKSYAVQGGINLQTLNPVMPNLAIGFSRSQLYLNLGTFEITDGSPTPVASFKGYEQCDMNSAGLALKYGITLSAGVTNKSIISSLAPINVQGQGRPGIAYVGSYDYGMMAQAPLIDLIERAGVNLDIGSVIAPVVNISTGFSRNNLGDARVVYIDAAQADPLPRIARVGVGTQLGLNYKMSESKMWELVGFNWTAESNTMLLRRFPAVADSDGVERSPPSWEYHDGFGDIQFYNELLAGHSNNETMRKRGWELSLAEIVTVRVGRFDESKSHGNRHFGNTGLTVRSDGVWKLLKVSGVLPRQSSWIISMIEQINFSYTHAEWQVDEYDHPLSGTKQDGWMVTLTN